VELVETSPRLRQAQAERVPRARWHDEFGTLEDKGPLLIVANEFFDALPARQLIATPGGWRERLVTAEGDRFVPKAGPPIPADAIPGALRSAPPGTVLETSPASLAVIRLVAQRLAAQGGVALIIDYGHARTSAGETLQAVRGHRFADPWTEPGERDLTVHVDFEALAAAARAEGVRALGPVGQGPWLETLGIGERSAALASAAPRRRIEIEGARDRLVAPDQMGALFKVLGLAAPGWPDPAGLA
jgi:NADH dehydrogenase [ubiquinone] 1 alpha subcomplex assembly factor 7